MIKLDLTNEERRDLSNRAADILGFTRNEYNEATGEHRDGTRYGKYEVPDSLIEIWAEDWDPTRNLDHVSRLERLVDELGLWVEYMTPIPEVYPDLTEYTYHDDEKTDARRIFQKLITLVASIRCQLAMNALTQPPKDHKMESNEPNPT